MISPVSDNLHKKFRKTCGLSQAGISHCILKKDKNRITITVKKISVLLVQYLVITMFGVAGLIYANPLKVQQVKIDMADRFRINKDASYVTFNPPMLVILLKHGSTFHFQTKI